KNSTSVPKALCIDCQNLDVKRLSQSEMMDIGTPCRETIYFIYNLVRVSIRSVSLVGMKCADLESLVVPSLKPPKCGNQLRFLIQRVPSGRTSNALSIPRRVMTNALTRSGLIRSFRLKASATTFAFPGW
ncbi:hypothetical protein Tco_1324996, partial [Tanacetum coccineum]